VLEERDNSDVFKKWLAYGNYIDELLLSSETTLQVSIRTYLHDHLYSPVAMLYVTGSLILERYEYDAYGQPTVMNGSYVVKQPVDYLNNYLFTGREVDPPTFFN